MVCFKESLNILKVSYCMTADSHGVFYVAAGKKYVDEACRSAQSLKTLNASLKISIACNQNPEKIDLFDQIILVDETVKSRNEGLLFKTKYLYTLSPYKRTLFVDTDTYFIKDVESGFATLDYFDVVTTLSIADKHYPTLSTGQKIDCKPVNTGVIFFRKNEANDHLFKEWLRLYLDKLSQNPNLRESDQTSFTESLMYAASRFYPLPIEWNTRFCFINTLQEPVRVLHAQSKNIEKIASLINTDANQLRVWIPHLNKCIVHRPYNWRHALGKLKSQLFNESPYS